MIDAILKPHPQDDIIHPENYTVTYTGEYSILKNLGYNFQKLYAANYQQWNKGDIRVWKRGRVVTHDELGGRFPAVLNILLNLGVDNLPFEPSSYFTDTRYLNLYIHKDTFECTTDPTQYNEGRKRFWESWDKIKSEKALGVTPTTELEVEDWVKLVFTPESVEPLRQLIDKGLIKIQKSTKSKNQKRACSNVRR